MRRHRPDRVPVRAAACGLALLLGASTAAEGAALTRSVFSSGAVDASGSSLRLRATLGESGVVGRAVGGGHVLVAGFWGGHRRIVATDAPADPGDGSVLRWADGLRGSAPNPFSGATAIEFTVAAEAPVRLVVHDVAGRRVATLADAPHAPGAHRVHWDGRDAGGRTVASGVYFLRLEIGDWSATRKVLKIR